MVYGLLGGRLKHSLSPQIHKYLCGYNYSLFEMPEGDVEKFIKRAEFDAINVTIPYKKTVMPYLSRIDESAVKIGSVNTIKKEKDGSLSGYNTDYYGFLYLLKRNKIEVMGKKAIILGSGGSCVTVKAVLTDLGADIIKVISRNGEDNYSNIAKHFDADIVVNTTPVGMYPQNLESPIDITFFKKCSAVIDIIYNPLKTKLLLDAERMGIKIANGLSMLVAQAKMAAEIFTDTKMNDSEIERVLALMEKDAQNIVLVGMPGCGKSTLASIIGAKLGKRYIDTDKMVEEFEQAPIPLLFEKYGEDYFRDAESKAAYKAGSDLSCVIATGGGIVKRSENFDALRQNGYIVFLDREVTALATAGRPLSVSLDRLYEMYNERYSLYEKICDVKILVKGTEEKMAEEVIKAFLWRDNNEKY